jgi:hypothetical protein
MINQRKNNLYFTIKITVGIVIVVIFTCIGLFVYHEKTFSQPNSIILKTCEEKILVGMSKEETIFFLGQKNLKEEVKENDSSYHILFSYNGQYPMVWDYQVYISFKNGIVVDKDCYWGF